MSKGSDLIAQERQRQIDVEGYGIDEDQVWVEGELVKAAICYARPEAVCYIWPWDADYWNPTPNDRIRELTKAGALIAAEIDRLSASK